MNEIVTIDNAVQYTKGSIQFNGYLKILNRAHEIAEQIGNQVVTEDNIKSSKAMIADVRKLTDAIEKRRIQIKKEILEPYSEFEKQVKEIVEVIKDAEDIVRQQVRHLEEVEREKKREKIEEIFNLRLAMYDFPITFKLDDWLQPKHLNKTVSINKVEEDMTEWLETRKKDIKTLETMFHDEVSEVLAEYYKTFDLNKSIETFNANKEAVEIIKANMPSKKVYLFRIDNAIEAKLVERILKENEINYVMEVK